VFGSIVAISSLSVSSISTSNLISTLQLSTTSLSFASLNTTAIVVNTASTLTGFPHLVIMYNGTPYKIALYN
jgi:hypothetical protein